MATLFSDQEQETLLERLARLRREQAEASGVGVVEAPPDTTSFYPIPTDLQTSIDRIPPVTRADQEEFMAPFSQPPPEPAAPLNLPDVQLPQIPMSLPPGAPPEPDLGTDPSRVYTLQGRDVVDTARLSAREGMVPTHRVGEWPGRRTGESVEEWEQRVINRQTWSPDTAQVANLDRLAPEMRTQIDSFMAAAAEAGVNLKTMETRRRQERQEMLFQKGRIPGQEAEPVTWTLTSEHTPGNAIDFLVNDDITGADPGYQWVRENAGRFGLNVPLPTADPGHVSRTEDQGSIRDRLAKLRAEITEAPIPLSERFPLAPITEEPEPEKRGLWDRFIDLIAIKHKPQPDLKGAAAEYQAARAATVPEPVVVGEPAEPTQPPGAPEARPLPEPTKLQRFGAAAGEIALTRGLMYQKPVAGPGRTLERTATRITGGTLTPEGMEGVDLSELSRHEAVAIAREELGQGFIEDLGQMVGSLIDPTVVIPFVLTERVAFSAIKALAKKGVPAATRFVQLATAPKTAPIAERALAAYVRALGTVGTAAVATEAVQKAGREGEVISPEEAALTFAGATALIPPIAAAMPGAGALIGRLRVLARNPTNLRNLGPRVAQEVRQKVKTEWQQGRKESDADYWVRVTEDELGFSRRVLGTKKNATVAEIEAAFQAKAGRADRALGTSRKAPIEPEVYEIYTQARDIALVGAQEPPVSRGLQIAGAPTKPEKPAEPPTEAPIETTFEPSAEGRAAAGQAHGDLVRQLDQYASELSGVVDEAGVMLRALRKGKWSRDDLPTPPTIMQRSLERLTAEVERMEQEAGDNPSDFVQKRLSDVRRLHDELTGIYEELGITPLEEVAEPGLKVEPTEAPTEEAPVPEGELFKPPSDPAKFVRPRKTVTMATQDLGFDPVAFQFKPLGSKGVSGELDDVEVWNDDLGGVVSVWYDPARGQTFIVNGHNRWDLANRLGQPELEVRFVEASTPEIARAMGAIINIGEGRGEAVDVGKFIRDTGMSVSDLTDMGISLRGDLARKGIAVSRLSQEIFDDLAAQKIPEGWGVAIGEVLSDPVLQRAVMKAIRGSRVTEAEVREVAHQVKAAGTETIAEQEAQGEMFEGSEDVALWVPKAQVAARLKRRINRDKRLFGELERNAEELSRAGATTIDREAAGEIAETSKTAKEIFERLYTRSGPVADAVTEAARRIANGEKVGDVVNEIYAEVGEAIEAESKGTAAKRGDAGDEEVPAGGPPPAGAGEPGGVEGAEVAPTEGTPFQEQYRYWQSDIDYSKPSTQEWLKGNRETITAKYREPIPMDPARLAEIPGRRGEEGKIDTELTAKLAENMRAEGWQGGPVLVEIDHTGKAWIFEGNHRIRAAMEAGLTEIPVELKYLGGGEQVTTFKPEQAIEKEAAEAEPEGPVGEGFFGEPVERATLGGPADAEIPIDQGTLLDEAAGTKRSRNLAQHERAMETELEVLREKAKLEKDASRKKALAIEISEKERLVNREKKITAEEMAARAAAASEAVKVGKKPNKPESSGELFDRSLGEGSGPFETATAQVSVKKTLRPISSVELVRLVVELLGKNAIFVKKYPQARGIFYGVPGDPKIGLSPELGKDAEQFVKTLAHEAGHLIDFLPDEDLRRGNILGRLATLLNFLSETIDKTPTDPSIRLTSNDRKAIRRQAQKRVGKRPAKDNEEDLAIWKQEVSEKYAEMIREEVEARNLLTRQEVQEEVLLLSEWWRPFDRTTASEGEIAYRESSREVYADMLSVLLNSPGTLQERAPLFFDAFMGYLERKPEVEAAYDAIQSLIGAGDEAIYAARRAEILADFARGEQIQREAEERKDPQSFYSYMVQQWMTRSQPGAAKERARVKAEAKAAKKPIPPAHSAVHAFKMSMQEWNHADNVDRIFLQDVSEKVHKPMMKAEIESEQAGMYLMLSRIADGDRGGMQELAQEAIMDMVGKDNWKEARAEYLELIKGQDEYEGDEDLFAWADKGIINPKGYTVAEARRTLADLKKELGPEKYAQLEQSMSELHDLHWRTIQEAVDVGSYNKKIAEERLYPNKDTYAPYAVTDYFNGTMTAGIRRQIGTVKGVANPYDMLILKTMALNRLNERQKAVTALVDILDIDFSGQGPVRKIDKYHREQRAGKGKRNLHYLVDGKLFYREVDAYIADQLEQSSLGALTRLAKTFASKTYGFFHPLYVTWSLGWQVRNLPRDWKRTYKNLAAAHAGKPTHRQLLEALLDIGRLNKAYAQTAGVAWRHARRKMDTQIRAMLKDRALGRAFHSFEPIETAQTPERLLQRFGITKPRPGGFKGGAQKAGGVIETVGVFQETWSKAASYKLLGEMGITGRDRAYMVRNYTGTPDATARGLSSDISNSLFMYSNVIVAGVRADWEVGTQPSTFAGYWFRSVVVDYSFKALMAAGTLGYLGKEIEEWFDGVPSYDLEKYIIVPVPPFYSTNEKGDKKRIYLRIPHDDVNRILAASTWAIFTAHQPNPISHAVGIVAGEFPGVTPMIKLPLVVGQAAADRNPWDSFRARSVVPRTEWDAGGWPRWKEVGRHVMGEFGIVSQVLGHWTYASPAEGESAPGERALRAVPGVSSLIKITDRGLNESRYWELDWETRNRARLRTDLSVNVRRATSERNGLNRFGIERLTIQEEGRRNFLNNWYRAHYLPQTARMKLAKEQGDKEAYNAARDRLDESLKRESGPQRPGRSRRRTPSRTRR